MKKMIMTCVLLGSAIATAFSQHIELKGVVREVQSNEPLAFVNVVLQTPDSAFVTGAVSDDNGRFAVPKVKPGDYRLALSFMGYKTLYIEMAGLTKNLTLPDILMEEEAVGLEAVTVTGSAITSRIDRKLVFPTKRQVQASTNGIDLLQQLMLPGLQINPVTREVSVPNGEVQLRINGVKAGINDVSALQPGDVIRVEYHDSPGLRYGNIEAVIDYIVRRHEAGGNAGVSVTNAPQLKKFGDNSIYGRINHRKSEFSVNYATRHRDFNRMMRDNEETFNFADGSSLQRKETGEPGHLQWATHDLTAAYSYLNEKRMFNTAFRCFFNNRPHEDYNARLYHVANPDDYVRMIDYSKMNYNTPSLDLYYQENLKNDQILVLNLVGAYLHTNSNRMYRESRTDLLLTDINNTFAGNRYSWVGEGIYEKKLGNNSLSAGLRHMQARIDNTYRNGHEDNTEMQQHETYLYSEWKGTVKKLNYSLGTGITRSGFRQKNGVDYDTWTFNPRLTLFYPLSDRSSLRLTAQISNNMPLLSELSAVEQQIDSLLFVRGNPDMHPYLRYRTELTYEWRKGLFYANLRGKYQYLPSPIMEERFAESDRIVHTWNNQKSWQYISALLNLRIGPIKDILTVSVNGGIDHFVSHGNTYRHVYTKPFFDATMLGMYRNFNAMFMWRNPMDWFYGETLSGGEKIYMFSLGYKYREMNFGIAAYSPFDKTYHVDSEIRSSVAYRKRRLHINDMPGMVVLKFAYN
ncbi:MAG: carboxypeptidase-like regulatory domain-containing protein, partial [Tannerella sp.]|nr:carboxypeptidase-like regulatory domain-containing protein [Tannerella sp.]